VFGTRKLQDNEPPRPPVPLQRFAVAAADKKASSKRLERARDERAVLSIGLWVMDIDVGNDIRGHHFSSLTGIGQRNPTPRQKPTTLAQQRENETGDISVR
jgi:hypothetical protein